MIRASLLALLTAFSANLMAENADPNADNKKRMVILLEHCTNLANWANDISRLTHFNQSEALPSIFEQFGWTQYDQISFVVNEQPKHEIAQQYAGKQANFLIGPTGILATDEVAQGLCAWPQNLRPLIPDYTRSVPANAPAILGVTKADQATMSAEAHREKRTQFVLMGECTALTEVANDITSVAMEADSSSDALYNNLGWVYYDTLGVKISAQAASAKAAAVADQTALFMIGTTGIYANTSGQTLCGWGNQFKPLDPVYPRNVPAEHPRVASMFK